MTKILLVLGLVLVGLNVLLGMHYHPLMPDQMACHFDMAGNVNGWQSKSMFYGIFYGSLAIVFFSCFLPALLMGKLPHNMINLPNKSYWLAPERRESTMNSVASFMMELGCVVLVLEFFIMQMVFRSNAASSYQLPKYSMALVILFFFYTLVKAIAYVVRFSRVPK